MGPFGSFQRDGDHGPRPVPHQGTNLEQPHQGANLVVSQLGWGLGVGNAGTLARLGGEGWGLLFGGEQKVAKTLFASVAGWAKDGTGGPASASRPG